MRSNVLDNLDTVLWESDPASLTFSFVSARAQDMLGFPPADWISHPNFLEEHSHPDDRMACLDTFRRVTELGGEAVLDHRLVAANGATVHLRTHICKGKNRLFGAMFAIQEKALHLADGAATQKGSVSVLSELSESLHLLTQERQARAEAEQAVRARDEFLSIASHELRSPIASLQLAFQGLLRISETRGLRDAPPPFVNTVLETCERQTKRLSRLVSVLLDVSQIAGRGLHLERGPVDLGALVHEVLELCQGQIRECGSQVSLDMPEPVMGFWDRGRLDQVLTNLVSNALKFGEGKPVTIAVSSTDNRARCVVSDQGIGIAPERFGTVFDCFEQGVSTQHYGGLGLGLYIARTIIREHGGDITLSSDLGRGSTFVVDLPCGDVG